MSRKNPLFGLSSGAINALVAVANIGNGTYADTNQAGIAGSFLPFKCKVKAVVLTKLLIAGTISFEMLSKVSPEVAEFLMYVTDDEVQAMESSNSFTVSKGSIWAVMESHTFEASTINCMDIVDEVIGSLLS